MAFLKGDKMIMKKNILIGVTAPSLTATFPTLTTTLLGDSLTPVLTAPTLTHPQLLILLLRPF